MFGEKIFNFSEPISRKTVRIVILVSFLAYQGMRLLWKQGLIPPLLFFSSINSDRGYRFLCLF